MNSRKSIIIKCVISLSSLLYFILFLPDFVFVISWLTKCNFYDLAVFLEEKPYLRDDAFAYNISEAITSYWYISIIIAAILIIAAIIDILVLKEKRSAFITAYSLLILFTLIITVFVIKHHNLLMFYDSPSNDLPWDYRKMFWSFHQSF